ncbi:thymidine kinase 2, mitochondrial-like [Dendronephthya gigantea]|uniref:thymidine kinase 2, mitochondrial-like n=1 Tax=Dendronephthya gigantea TaxID=151771 RepID=UPI00106DB45D|nr:thymidine kinase 2, mitochondrial-like [Dendronephthya gigantea]
MNVWKRLTSRLTIFRNGILKVKVLGNGKNHGINSLLHTENDVKSINGKKFKVSIEGNIGSGKTTLLEYFKKYSHVEVIPEPVEEWQNVGDGNTLGLFYQDPSRWSYLFQSYVLLTMLEIHQRKQHQPVTLMERSVYSAGYCFVENLHKNGLMSSVEYSVYRKWFERIVKEEKPCVDLIVYLRTSPEECYKRIKRRSRKEETDIPMSLITSIHQHYEDWLIKKTKFEIPAPVLVLDGNKELKDMFKLYETNTTNILLGMGDEPITCRE